MCGIVFMESIVGGRVSKHIFRRYKEQQSRGTKGYGCVTIHNKKIDKILRSVDEEGIKAMLPSKGDMILFHHRNPTSTPNFEACTHPIFVSNESLKYDYYVVHNGIISNATLVKTDFEKLGFKYTTLVEQVYRIGNEIIKGESPDKFNDSESFAIDIARIIEDPESKETKSMGSIAFVILQVDKKNKSVIAVHYGRNYQNPLKIDKTNNKFILASEGVGEDVEPHKLHRYDLKTRNTTARDLKISYNYTPPSSSVDSKFDYETRRDQYARGHQRALPLPKKTLDVVKKEEPIDCTISLYENGKISKKIDYKQDNKYLFKTKILIENTMCMSDNDWTWYARIMNDINSYTKKGKEMKDFEKRAVGFYAPSNKMEVQKKLQMLHVELKHFTEQINNKVSREKYKENLPRERTGILSEEDERKLAIMEREDM